MKEASVGTAYLSLIQRLTAVSPEWGIWKNVDKALEGSGDIDSAAPRHVWRKIESEFADWAREFALGPVSACRHVRGVLFLIALDRDRRTFFELDVNDRKYFRGWTFFRAEELVNLMVIDERNFRRVKSGVEAVILLTQNAMAWGGRARLAAPKAARVREMLAGDPEGVAAASRLFGRASGALQSLAASVVDGKWNRGAALRVEAYCLSASVADPRVLAGRLMSRGIKKRDPLLRSIFVDDRRLPADVDGWISRIAAGHEVLNGLPG